MKMLSTVIPSNASLIQSVLYLNLLRTYLFFYHFVKPVLYPDNSKDAAIFYIDININFEPQHNAAGWIVLNTIREYKLKDINSDFAEYYLKFCQNTRLKLWRFCS